MLGRLFRGKPQPGAAAGEDGALAQAVADHHAGRLAQAQAGYEAVLAREPRAFTALHMLGVLALQVGNAEDAALWIARALEVLPSDAGARNNLGEALRLLGRLPEATESYRAAIAIAPDYADAHFNLAGVLRRQGRNEEAVQSYRTAVSLNPSFAAAHLRLGETLNRLGRPAQAIEALQAALALDGNLAKAHSTLGVALGAAGRLDEALASCQRAIALQPELAIAHLNAGNVLRELGFVDEAIAAYRAAIERDPRSAEAFNNLGNVLKHQGKLGEALQCYDQAIALAPEFAEPRLNAARFLRENGLPAEAAVAFRALLEGYPGLAEAHFDLGNALSDLGDAAGALECYRKALQFEPEFAEARWALAMSQLPLVAEDEAAQAAGLTAFARELDALRDWCAARGPEKVARAVGTQQPSCLAYQEGNHRDVAASYGRLCSQLMGAWQQAARIGTPAPVTRAEIRVGIAFAHVRDHAVWNAIVKGWLQNLDRNRFDVRLFHLGRSSDVETALAKTLVTHYTYGKTDAVAWAPLILDHQLDVLIYPEIGTDSTTARLASMRLAPVQVASWGHPITTGLPTIDCFLSADALEPAQADGHYTERLVRLPRLGCWVEPPGAEPPMLEPASLGIRDGVPLLVCAGTPFKYTPRHDALLAAIARRLGECQFVFFAPQPADPMERVRARMGRAFASAGLDFARFAAFVPMLNRPALRGLLAQADVCLDTIGFSDFGIALHAIESGLPIVAWESGFLRGRLASGVLRQMGLGELVASDDAAYVDTAARVALDARYWGSARERMLAARGGLYRDAAPVRALEKFLESVVNR